MTEMPSPAKARSEGETTLSAEIPSFAHERELSIASASGERELFAELIRPYERRVYITAFAILQNEIGRAGSGPGGHPESICASAINFAAISLRHLAYARRHQ